MLWSTGQASGWICISKIIFFLFIHFFDAHWPYKAPKKYGGNNAYEEEVAYADHYLGLFIDKLKKENLFEKSTIICFSDHGEDLNGLYENDKGGKDLGHPEEFGHGCLLYDQTQKVILIIKDEALPKNKNIEQQVRLVDIAPTALALMKIKLKVRKSDGVSLLPVVKGNDRSSLLGYSETFYPEEQTSATGGKFSFAKNKKSFRVDNKYKTIIDLEGDKIEFYNINNDPNELNNLIK